MAQTLDHQVAPGNVLRVVGGSSNGGIIVRTKKDTKSAELCDRLALGSLVKVLEHANGRLSYELVDGTGPSNGWVSLSCAGRPLLTKYEGAFLAENHDVSSDESGLALQWYCKRLAEAKEAGRGDIILDRKSFPKLRQGKSKEVEKATGNCCTRADIEMHAAWEDEKKQWLADADDRVEDSDGEGHSLCHWCRLPLGDNTYTVDSKGRELMHGECVAQAMLQNLRSEEEAARQREADLKRSRREQYDIGWKVEMAPLNINSASKLGCALVPQGMCCLVLNAENSVSVGATFEPAGALNLEYVSLALQVRRVDGREPFFSLDPLETAQADARVMQVKRFEPEWLAGTSVGEVMFQADYHLKELSMGEYEQPVVGMKSCFDLAQQEGFDKDWSAREWFVVRKAEVHVSEDAVLIPYLKMGVEAREQVVGPNGLEDATLTRQDHPLVQYAEAFTKNFDLIAERKSVIAQLREVAKASIVAKFMLESGMDLGEQWFSLGEQMKNAICLEVPQLWNDRASSRVHVEEGGIMTAGPEKGSRIHSVYGGVDFGIDRFRLAMPTRIATSVVAGRAALGRPASTLLATSQVGLSMPTRQFTRLAAPITARASLVAPSRLAAPLSARAGLAAPISAMSAARPATSLLATSRLSVGPPRAGLAAPLSAISAARPATSLMATSRLSMAAPQVATARLSMGMPRGVDLNLDKFNLSAVAEAGEWARTIVAPEGLETLAVTGKSFWRALEGKGNIFEAEDTDLLREVFNPFLSDRRAEADLFVPPPTSLTYMHKLETLVKEEAAVRKRREELFFSRDFMQGSPGPLFPSTWNSNIKASEEAVPSPFLRERLDYQSEEAALLDLLSGAIAVFDRRTEDGVRFLIYRLGSLEVRVTEAHDGARKVGAVFSSASPGMTSARAKQQVKDDAEIVKATLYAERAFAGALRCRFYTVLETREGALIVTEKLTNGTIVWKEEDPALLADRNSLAKVLLSAEVLSASSTVGAARALSAEGSKPGAAASPSSCKRYARAAFWLACRGGAR